MTKYTKIEVTVEDNGRTYKRILTEGDAQLWTEYMVQVCLEADKVGKNPQWHLLRWKEEDVKPDEEGVNIIQMLQELKDMEEGKQN